MKAFITGAAGFIGSHLAESISRRGGRVIMVDDLSQGNRGNLAWIRPGDTAEFIEADAADPRVLHKALPGCDVVFHEAALASVPLSVADPAASHARNLETTFKLLIAARDAKVKRFVFASSSAIYGDSEVSPKQETMPVNPLTPYALQKFAAERYAQFFHTFYGFPTVSLRYFNVFGPRQAFDSPYSGVIARFCTMMLDHQAPIIFGDGLQSRDFVFIDNVVEANLKVAEAPAERVGGRVFNVAGGQSITVLELVAELNRLTGQSLEPSFAPARAGDVRQSSADIAALRDAVDFAPAVSWQEGLERTLASYREADDRMGDEA